MRCKKLAGMGSVAASLQHCFRERDTPNADQDRTPENEHRAAASTDEAMGRMRALLPEKRRKDAVLAVEYVMTASPSWWASASADQQREFFDRSLKWLTEKYGADRIVTATIHRDETSPHLSAFVVPLTRDGRLSAKEFIGAKAQMTADQTSFAKAVQDLGLERGIEGSRATHQRVQSFYGAIEQQEGHVDIQPSALEPRVLEKGFLTKTVETPAQVAQRLTKSVNAAYAPALAKAARADLEARRASEARQALEALQKRVEPFLRALEPLREAGRSLFARIVAAAGEKLLGEQQAEERQRKIDAQARIALQRERGRDARGRGGPSL